MMVVPTKVLSVFTAGCVLVTIARAGDVYPVVEVEELITRYTPADNGAGPLWCYGSTCIARLGHDVFSSIIETGKDVPPLCNTRWQLWQRNETGWRMVRQEQDYRQREPCPIATFREGPLWLSVNPSTQPTGTRYGECEPQVLAFDPKQPGEPPDVHRPAFAVGAHFTDHSYRGFAADGRRGELLLVNIDAPSGAQYLSYRDDEGAWHAKGRITFPIRSCYPQVMLRDRAAYVMAIGDIVEPNREWRELKSEKLQREWDYVFRRLFLSYTPDVRSKPFCEPIEIDNVDDTCGHITNLDLHVDEEGTAHLLYLKVPVQYAFIRDRYFPDSGMERQLVYARVEQGNVVDRSVVAYGDDEKPGSVPHYGRFVIDGQGELHVVLSTLTRLSGGSAGWYMYLLSRLDKPSRIFTPIEVDHPFRSFMTATPRAGTEPTELIDLFGVAGDGLELRYARIRLNDYDISSSRARRPCRSGCR